MEQKKSIVQKNITLIGAFFFSFFFLKHFFFFLGKKNRRHFSLIRPQLLLQFCTMPSQCLNSTSNIGSDNNLWFLCLGLTMQGSGLPIYMSAASANHNVTNNIPREELNEWPPRWLTSQAQKRSETLVGSGQSLQTTKNGNATVCVHWWQLRDASYNQTRQWFTFIQSLESDPTSLWSPPVNTACNMVIGWKLVRM